MSISSEDWVGSGTLIRIGGHYIFFQQAGQGSHMTLLHGFPTCSWDWSRIWPQLTAEHCVLAPDLLGFGHSDKPSMRYTFDDHADRLEALWARQGVTTTTLVAHDYSVTLAQELLARQQEGRLAVGIERVILLNGGLQSRLHRARPIQKLLVSPVGPVLARFMRRERFAKSFSRVFVNPPSEDELDAFWALIRHNEGHKRTPALLQYMADRRRYAERWEGALKHARVPIRFVWGMEDPVSGAHMLEGLRDVGPVVELPVGHYPQWEAPDAVVEAVLEGVM